MRFLFESEIPGFRVVCIWVLVGYHDDESINCCTIFEGLMIPFLTGGSIDLPVDRWLMTLLWLIAVYIYFGDVPLCFRVGGSCFVAEI